MGTYLLWHADNGLRYYDSITDLPGVIYPQRPIAQIEGELGEIFGLTQHLETGWCTAQDNYGRGKTDQLRLLVRSTSVGDLVYCKETGEFKVVAPFGYDDVPPGTFEYRNGRLITLD